MNDCSILRYRGQRSLEGKSGSFRVMGFWGLVYLECLHSNFTLRFFSPLVAKLRSAGGVFTMYPFCTSPFHPLSLAQETRKKACTIVDLCWLKP